MIKKLNDKRIIIGTMFLILIIGVIIKGKSENYKFDTIDFPQFAGYISSDLKFEDETNKSQIKNEKNIQHVFIAEELISNDRRKKIKIAFKMDDNTSYKDNLRETVTRDNAQLVIYDNGTFQYDKGSNKEDKVMVSDAKSKEIAKKFLEDKQLIPKDFEYSGIGYDILSVEDGSKNGPQNKTVISKNVYFKRKVDNSFVEGTSQIYVSIVGNGEVETVYSSYWEKSEEVKVEDNISIDDVIKKIEKLDGCIAISEEADKVVLTDIEVVYWEDSAPFSENYSIQPIYKVSGSCYNKNNKIDSFEALVTGLPDKYYK